MSYNYKRMAANEVEKLHEIDRSEYIDLIYEMSNGVMHSKPQNHECSNWDSARLKEIQERFLYELKHGGMAIGAFDKDTLAGFGVLAHAWRGSKLDTLQIDLMYVSRRYRRHGIATKIIAELADEARHRGAKKLYISSTETKSAVSFYKSVGSQLADEVDEELYDKEPLDIHMHLKL